MSEQSDSDQAQRNCSPLRALVVSYAFPPVGGAGVQRVLKLVKYLPAHGVSPTVLTVKNPSVPLYDGSLEADVPADLPIVRAATLEPSYQAKRLAWRVSAQAPPDRVTLRIRRRIVEIGKQLLVPDPQILWQPGAQRALLRRLASVSPDDVVFVSGPPFSQFLLGALARTKPGTAVVFDYRDEWSTSSSSYEMSSGATARAAALLEAALLRSAHAVTTATEAFREHLLARFAFLEPSRVVSIPNGYDPDDFSEPLPEPPSDRFVLTYAGTIFRLTSAAGLLAAVRRLHEREPELARLLELRFLGRVVETEQHYFRDSERLGVRCTGYVDHARVIGELARSHATLCILDDVPGTERIYPAKIFELMRLGRPCLTLAPEGALSELVRRHQLGRVVSPRDTGAICDALAEMLRAFVSGAPPTAPGIDIERYDRRRQAGEFAAIFRRAAAEARRSAIATAPRLRAARRANGAPPQPFLRAASDAISPMVKRFLSVSTLREPALSARR